MPCSSGIRAPSVDDEAGSCGPAETAPCRSAWPPQSCLGAQAPSTGTAPRQADSRAALRADATAHTAPSTAAADSSSSPWPSRSSTAQQPKLALRPRPAGRSQEGVQWRMRWAQSTAAHAPASWLQVGMCSSGSGASAALAPSLPPGPPAPACARGIDRLLPLESTGRASRRSESRSSRDRGAFSRLRASALKSRRPRSVHAETTSRVLPLCSIHKREQASSMSVSTGTGAEITSRVHSGGRRARLPERQASTAAFASAFTSIAWSAPRAQAPC